MSQLEINYVGNESKLLNKSIDNNFDNRFCKELP